jgi:hypothetical protein
VCCWIFCKKVVLDCVDVFLSTCYCCAVMWFIYKFLDIDFSTTGPTRCTVCFQFILINSLYMFRALICSS